MNTAMDSNNNSPTNPPVGGGENTAITYASAAQNEEERRLQAERFLQLSQRCHEQNWAQVHALAEEIVAHRRQLAEENNKDEEEKNTAEQEDAVNNNASTEGGIPAKRAQREGSVSISGKILHVDFHHPTKTDGSSVDDADGGNSDNMNGETTNVPTKDGDDDDDDTNMGGSDTDNTGEHFNEGADSNNRQQISTGGVSSVSAMKPTTTPRMLSTCLGTASPLAWTCRYSAPSSTVKLVLNLDVAAVRRCLPQLGTPLHECVGRPRPLRKMPMKRGRWSLVDNTPPAAAAAAAGGGGTTTTQDTTTTATSSSSSKPRNKSNNNKGDKSKKKKKKHKRTPRILAGLREWRRTVRTLIQTDEMLMKEDLKYAALIKAQEEATAAANNDNEQVNTEEWRRNVASMIKENVTNIQTYKRATSMDEMDNDSEDGNESPSNMMMTDGSEQQQQQQQPALSKPAALGAFPDGHHVTVRATLAQDADGNTPLHFMIRGAAAPAFGGGRWQARHEVEEEEYSSEEEDEEDEEEAGATMDVDSSSNVDGRPNPRDLRHIEYWGTSGSSWDGVRWCMEAHLRRVERRMARQMARKEKVNEAYEDVDASDGERVARQVGLVRIGSPMDSTVDDAMPDVNGAQAEAKPSAKTTTSSAGDNTPTKLPAKRKSLEIRSDSDGGSVKSRSRKDSSSVLAALASVAKQTNKANEKKKPSSRRKKYLDMDECQDCKYDPLLGAVRDLVHTCPEAAGIPDHREYEETPLIVALKSSIYVVMEPDNDFQLVDRIPGAADGGGLAVLPQPGPGGVGGPGGRAVGDGFAIFGGGMLQGGNAGGLGGGGFPFPELGALMHNRPFNLFPDDEAMMAVLRGHGRRVTRDNARRRSSVSSTPRASSPVNPLGATNMNRGEEDRKKQTEGGENNDDDESACSSVSDDSSFDGEDDPRFDAFIPSSNEQIVTFGGRETPGIQLGLVPRRRPRYDYQTALEYRIFCLVRIMLDAYPRAACLMISDYTPLHSAVFHGRCPDTIRLLLDAEARFRSDTSSTTETQANPSPSTAPQFQNGPEPCPTLTGPAMLCTNTRGELPLHFACMRNECARSIQLLAEADPRAALVRDASGRTPLRWLWIRFVDGLLDRFGGRDTQREDENGVDQLAFQEQEGMNNRNFPNPGGQNILGARETSMNDTFDNSGGRPFNDNPTMMQSSESMFVFDTEYLRRTRNIDRTVDFLRMRHVPSGFESIEYVAAEHAITVLLKLKYLQQRRNRQLEAYSAGGSGSNSRLPPDIPLSTKEEFILYAFEKFTALIYAALVASEAQDRLVVQEEANQNYEEGVDSDFSTNPQDLPSRKQLWHSLTPMDPNKKFYIVHEACGASRASCPAAVAKICIKLWSDQMYQRDDDGRLPLHRVALRGIGWEPPGSDIDTSHASLADETLTLLKEVLSGSHERAPEMYDNNRQLPLHCAVDSIVTSLVMGKRRRASLHAEARVALQKHRHSHVEIAMECLSVLLLANSSALQRRDGQTGLYPFMQAALPHQHDCAVVKYTSDLSRRPGFDVGVGFHSMEREVVEEDDMEADSDHVTIIYFLLREDPSVINGLGI